MTIPDKCLDCPHTITRFENVNSGGKFAIDYVTRCGKDPLQHPVGCVCADMYCDKNERAIDVSDLKQVLTGGSQYEGGKMRIYALYQTEPARKKRIEFLKKEYGCGGHTIYIDGRSGFVDFSPKGVKLSIFGEDNDTWFSWGSAEDALRELIDEDTYLTAKDRQKWAELMQSRTLVPYPEPRYKYPQDEEDEE